VLKFAQSRRHPEEVNEGGKDESVPLPDAKKEEKKVRRIRGHKKLARAGSSGIVGGRYLENVEKGRQHVWESEKS